MRTVLIALATLAAASASADGGVPVPIGDGTTRIPVTVVNTCPYDTPDLTVEVTAQLPDWIGAVHGGNSVTAPRGEAAGTPILLAVTVDGPLPGVETVIPCRIVDDAGRYWEFAIPVRYDPDAVTAAGDERAPAVFALHNAYPNPFNPATTIPFSLAARGGTTLVIYNMLGQPVRTLVDGVLDAGAHDAVWDGRADNGGRVSSGVYVCRLRSGRSERTIKLLLNQ